MKRLFAAAVLAVAFSASLPAQGTDETSASFHDEPKAELAVELIKNMRGYMTVPIITPTTVTDIAGWRERNCPTT